MTRLHDTFTKLNLKWELPPSRVAPVLDHSAHLSKHLFATRQSHAAAVASFTAITQASVSRMKSRYTCLTTSSQSESLLSLHNCISKWFFAYCRLRDASVYLESGECRHPIDVATANANRFKSNLPKKGTSRDGYTKCFRADCYSGFGWDDFYDDEVGLRRRMAKALGKQSRFETLMERSGFEMAMDSHSQELANLQAQVSADVESFLGGVNKYIVGAPQTRKVAVEMKKLDKQECMTINVTSTLGAAFCMKMKIERTASNFTLKKEGVQPEQYGRDDWDRLFKLPKASEWTGEEEGGSKAKSKSSSSSSSPAAAKKRKRIIDDDSDSDSDEESGGGLTVSLTMAAPTASAVTTVNVSDMKTDFGFDSVGMAAQHEGLLGETAGWAERKRRQEMDKLAGMEEKKEEVAAAEVEVEKVAAATAAVAATATASKYMKWGDDLFGNGEAMVYPAVLPPLEMAV